MHHHGVNTITKKVAVALIGLFLLSGLLHVIHISYPDRPVFDEAHFATYAADYLHRVAFVDVHPPLGKMFYASLLAFTPHLPSSKGSQFVSVTPDPKTKIINIRTSDRGYGSYPYVSLRVMSAFVGALLVLLMFWFLRTLGVSQVGALLGALCVALENAFLLETKLILLNGMYLAFGLLALIAYFSKPRPTALSGAAWGLSLAVKLIGVVFFGPILIFSFLEQAKTGVFPWKEIRKFLMGAAVVYLVVLLSNNFFFSIKDRAIAFREMLMQSTTSTQSHFPSPSIVSYLSASGIETLMSGGGYLGGEGGQEPFQNAIISSPWYFWPVMQWPMNYYDSTDGGHVPMVLKGNPVVWFGATLAVVFAVALAPRHIKRWFMQKDESAKIPLVLLGGYVFSLLPYFTFVKRTAFLYHYFPAYLFGIGLLAWGISTIFHLDRFETLTKKQTAILVCVVLVIAGGFVWNAPTTYGFLRWW